MFGFVLDDMSVRNIRYDHCPLHDCEAPLSSVLLNEQTGSRTIVHSNPDMPILTAQDFQSVDLHEYAWVHFEVRINDAMYFLNLCLKIPQYYHHHYCGSKLCEFKYNIETYVTHFIILITIFFCF